MRHYAALLLALLAVGAYAQLAHGGAPLHWGQPLNGTLRSAIPALLLDSLDPVAALIAADTAGAPGGHRFGVQRALQADLAADGHWTDLPDGGRVCRLELRSPGAAMMSVQFSTFLPAWGARLFLYDAPRTRFLGGFTTANQAPDGRFATGLLPGDALVLEYHEPPGAAPGNVQVSHITHGWQCIFPRGGGAARDFNPGYQSDPCHNNVACPIAAEWEQQNRAVLMFVTPDGRFCDGTLLNNTLQDGTPYFLIANHCYLPTESQWVFYFNYQSPTCVGDTGQTQQSLTGAVRVSGLYEGDYNLLLLNDQPPASYQPYYAGWDRSGVAPEAGVSILTPAGDVKKISFSSTPAIPVVAGDAGTPCWEMPWFSGILQFGGSGAPFFDRNKRVAGHMVGGDITCQTALTAPAQASRFSHNWDTGTTPASRLRDWLAPVGNPLFLDGYDPNGAPPRVAVRAKAFLQGPYNGGAGLMAASLNDAGLLPLNEPYTALGYGHAGPGGGEATVPDVLAVPGTRRVVDWVVVELRDKNDPALVVATRSALLRRDGSIVSPDGVADVSFPGVGPDLYYVAIRHRNHLAIMTDVPQPLAATAQLLDLSDGSVALRGGADATTPVAGARCMWAGDVNGNGTVQYTGQHNDRDPVLLRIGSVLATALFAGYAAEDTNMDGVVKYTGMANDRDAFLQNLGGTATNVRSSHVP